MKRLSCLLCLLFCLSRIQGQNITAAEYFFDTDPGTGLGTPLAIGAPGTTVNFTANIPTTSLTPGFHALAIRTKDAGNMWGLFEARVLYISGATADMPPVAAAEYFIDSDPGPGNGTPINIGASGNTAGFSFNVPTAAMTPGFHILAIRARDAEGRWGLFEQRAFYITGSTADAGPVVAAEYFIDTDPGTGNGTPVSIGASGNVVNFTASIPTASLAPGFHMLAIRTRDANGVWGLFEHRAFYISSSTTDVGPVTSAEYFIDTDPGPGNGAPLSVGAPGNVVNFTASIPTASLAAGFHTLAIRTRDAEGRWGLFETRPFYISTMAVDMGAVTAAEYFLDADPGVGNGAPLTITSPGNTVNQTFLANVPPGTTPGPHLLAIRTRDANGVWGLFEARTFDVGGTLPLDWISFNGKRSGRKIVLEWVTEDEMNTDHFIVERSRNSAAFHPVGTVDAAGGAHNTYTFDDLQPFDGPNFYRLKQVDADGKFKYSAIINVYMGNPAANTLRLYPNPVKNTVTLQFGGEGKEVLLQVYDAAGKLVRNEKKANTGTLQLPVTALAEGMYWIVLSDGVTVQRGQFVKGE